MKNELLLEIDEPVLTIETWELRISCGTTSLIVARSYTEPFGAKPWVIKTSPSSLDRQTTYATVEEARDEAAKSVLFRERLRLYEAVLQRTVT